MSRLINEVWKFTLNAKSYSLSFSSAFRRMLESWPKAIGIPYFQLAQRPYATKMCATLFPECVQKTNRKREFIRT